MFYLKEVNMAFNNGDTILSYYKAKNIVHKLSTAEASASEVIISGVFESDKIGAADANVFSSAGAPRTLTKVTVISGVLDVTGSSFAAGDMLVASAFKYNVV